MSPRRGAITGPDKAKGVITNLRIQYDGDAVLASKNEVDAPRLDKFDINGDLAGWVLDSPPEETGIVPYALGPGFPRFTKQHEPLDFAVPFYDQRDPLINGDAPEDPTHRARIAPFTLPPMLQLISNGIVGYKPGWYGFTYAYKVGKKGKGLTTNCAPLVAVYLDNGQGAIVTLPETATEGVTFLVIGMTQAYATEAAALNATKVFVQKEIKTKPRIPATDTLKGPLFTKEKLSFTENETYLGGSGKLGKVRIKKKKKPGRKKSREDGTDTADQPTTLSYSINTEFGSTDRQGAVSTSIKQDEIVEFEPGDMPDTATSWTPHFTANTGNVQNMRQRKGGQKADLPGTDPNDVPDDTTTEPDPNKEDDSGIDGPTSALDTPVPYGHTVPVPGLYAFTLAKATIDPDDGKEQISAPGPFAKITVPAGYYVRLRPPRDYRNWIANPDATHRKTDTDETPEHWTRGSGVNIVPDDDPGLQRTRDTTGSFGDYEVALTDPFDVSEKPTVIHHAKIGIANYVSGRVDYIMRQKRVNTTTVDTVLGSWHANNPVDNPYEVTIRLAAAAAAKIDYVWDSAVDTVQFVLKHVGSSGFGARNLTSTLNDPMFIRGRKRPRKRKRGHPRPGVKGKVFLRVSPGKEEPPEPYPTFGYTTVVLDPLDKEKPVAFAGSGKGNFIEYYGPNGTPTTSTYFAGGLKMPAKPGEVRTISMHFYWEGVDVAGQPLKLVARDKLHRVIQDFGGYITGNALNFSEDQIDADANGWVRRYKTITVPANTAYLEFTPGAVGDGLYRIGWPQNELGNVMTAWTDDHAPSGSLVSTFDMGVPGVPQGSLATLSLIKRVIRFGAEVTPDDSAPAGTTGYTIEARSKSYAGSTWSAWVTDIEDFEPNDLIEVRTTLTTSDVNYTPELHSHFLDFERDSGLPGHGILCRVDGTEFNGGCTLSDFPPSNPETPRVDEEYADGSRGFGLMGKETRWARGFSVECQLNSTASEIMAIAGGESITDDPDEASCFVGEYLGRRYLLRILDMELKPDNREAHKPIPGMESDGAWNIKADSLEGEVLDEEPL